MNQRGFTILEVMLFLGITALLLTVSFIGTGAMAARQRFTDTTDSLHAFIQSQYEEVLNGVNTRSASIACGGPVSQPGAATASGCLLLGRIISFDITGSKIPATVVQSNYIVSNALYTPTAGETDQQKLVGSTLAIGSPVKKADGTTNDFSVGRYELKWGATISKATISNPSGRKNFNRLAIVRIPDSNRIVQVYYNSESDAQDSSPLRVAVSNASNYDAPDLGAGNPSAVICIKNDQDFMNFNVRSAIVLSDKPGSIVTNYEPGAICQ